MGTLLSLVHWILTETRLHVALLSRSHEGSSARSVSTSSFSSRFFSSPSPFSVDTLIWSCDRFFANLRNEFQHFQCDEGQKVRRCISQRRCECISSDGISLIQSCHRSRAVSFISHDILPEKRILHLYDFPCASCSLTFTLDFLFPLIFRLDDEDGY